MVYRSAVRSSYDVALRIPGHTGMAGRTHGHRYTAEAVLEADEIDGFDFVADFDEIQAVLERITGELDHRLLNDLDAFAEGAPSAERQARYLYERLANELGDLLGDRVRLARVRVIQEPGAWAEYRP